MGIFRVLHSAAASVTLLTAPMKIDCYLSEHCGSYYQLRDNVHAALRELGIDIGVTFHTVSYDEALSLGIPGSPTIRLDGRDLFEGASSPGIT
jgi:hypothetical protein